MITIKEHNIPGYEKVVEATCDQTKLHAFIAIHNTTLGPALGGTRFYPYSQPEDALKDVLRLSRAMSYKSAVIQDGLGGGKSVIIGDPKRDKSPELLHAFAELLNYLEGSYIAAEDVGTSVEDMVTIYQKSPYVAGLPTKQSCGDPSPFTARGIYRGLQACAKTLWHKPSLEGKTVVIQGLGNVGMKLAELLFWERAELFVSDPDKEKLDKAVHDFGAHSLDVSTALLTECDILIPCAMGGIITNELVPELSCLAIAGGANNQLATPEAGKDLFDKGILYAPDYVINAGGIINAAAEFDVGGYHPQKARDDTDKIFDTLMTIFHQSKTERKPTHIVADELAEYNLKNGVGKRLEPIRFCMV